jgi:hypothetical protein
MFPNAVQVSDEDSMLATIFPSYLKWKLVFQLGYVPTLNGRGYTFSYTTAEVTDRPLGKPPRWCNG